MGNKRLTVVAAVALGAIVGTGWASGAIGSIVGTDGAVNGCYKQQNGQLRVVASGEACGPSELPLQWSQKGPRGGTGPQGIQGPIGPQGQQGGPGPKGDTGQQGIQGLAGEKGLKGDDGAPGSAGAPGTKGDGGNSGPPGPPGPPGDGGTLANLDALDGIPCNTSGAGAGVTRVAYTNAAVAITCAPATIYTLTVTVSGTYQTPYTYGYQCGTSWAPVTCSGTAYNTYNNYATVAPISKTCSAATCTYSIPGGTNVSIGGRGTISAGGSSFTMTADKTVTVS